MVLVVITIISVTTAVLCLLNQQTLNHYIDVQNAKISDLIQVRKELQFGQQVNNDSSLTSLDQLKSMVQELKDRSDVMGASTSTTDTLPQPVGMVTLNAGVSSVNIYDNPAPGANIISSTLPNSPMFYYQTQGGYHQVEYSAGQLGWITDDLITEMTK